MSRDWHAWYRGYDDPASSLSARLAVVRAQLASLLAAAAPGPVRLLSLCAGDGRDALPVVAGSGAVAVRAGRADVRVRLNPRLRRLTRTGWYASGSPAGR